MKKIKYYYNTNTLRYEKLETPLRVTLLRVLGFLSSAIVTALILVSIAYKYFPSANEKRLMQRNEALQQGQTVNGIRRMKAHDLCAVYEWVGGRAGHHGEEAAIVDQRHDNT